MTIQRSLVAWTGVVLIVMTTNVVAQNAKNSSSQGNTPNGKPFQQIQSQFAAMNERINAVETQIDSVERGLQQQINAINTTIGGFQAWVASVNDAITALNSRNAANETLIAALQNTVGSLQASLVAVETDLTALENQVAAYQSDTLENAVAIQALQTQATQIQTLISTHTGQITALEGQIASTNQFLANMKGATCTVGQAVSGIQASGSLTCITPSGGGTADVQVAQSVLFVGAGLHTVVASCPLTYKVVGGGYAGATGMTVYGSFPNAATWVVNVDYKPAVVPTFATITAHARCVK